MKVRIVPGYQSVYLDLQDFIGEGEQHTLVGQVTSLEKNIFRVF